MCMKRGDKGKKSKDGKIVNQEFDLDWRAENGGNLSRAIPWIHLPLKKSAGVCFWILRVSIYSLIGNRKLGTRVVHGVF